jgi:hypothetical protein
MTMGKVFVVMEGDFPDSVFSTEDAAKEYVAMKVAIEHKKDRDFRRVHWTWYEFELR